MKTNWPFLFSICALLAGTSGPLRAQNAALLDDLVAYWPLDEVQGTRTPDKVNGYDLTVQNVTEADLIDGKRGKALRFDRTRSMMASRSNQPAEDLPVGRLANHTISLWAQAATISQNSLCLYAEGNTATDTPFSSIRSDNRVAGGQQQICVLLALRTNAGGNAILGRTAALPFDGLAWHHIVLTQSDNGDGTATRRVYIDGTEDLSADGTGFPVKTAGENYSLNTTAIGGVQRTSNSGFVTADIDEVAVWKRALNPEEVLDLMNNGLPPLGPPPDPLIVNNFSGDFNRVAAGRPVRLSWDVTKDAVITIDPAPGNVTGVSVFGVGSAVVTPLESTTYTLTLTRGAEPPVTGTFTVNPEEGIAAGWDLIDTFQYRNIGALGGQYPWKAGAGYWGVQGEGPSGNRVIASAAGETVTSVPLGSRSLAVDGKTTLFTRFLIPATSSADLHLLFGLSDKAVRFGSDWVTNNGPVVRLFRTAGGPPVLQARTGPGSDWEDANLEILPGTPYNVWIDIENVEGLEDVFSVHAGPAGGARSTLFTNLLSDRLAVEIPFLGFPGTVLNSLVVANPSATQNGQVLLDDFFLSTANAFNTTEPVPSNLTLTAPPGPLAITDYSFDRATGELLLRWASLPGASYTVEQTADPAAEIWNPVQTGIASAGAETSTFFTVPEAERGLQFYRVRQDNP